MVLEPVHTIALQICVMLNSTLMHLVDDRALQSSTWQQLNE